MIKNPDGSCFQLKGAMQIFDPGNREQDLFNRFHSEQIRQFGSPIFYYEVLIQPNTVDPLYIEDRGKQWSTVPIQLWCYYEPQPNKNVLGQFGIDAPDEVVFELNYRDCLNAVGHVPKVGSRLFTPHKGENWSIVQRNDGEFKMWGQLSLQLICQKFQESTTTTGLTKQPVVDFKLNPN